MSYIKHKSDESMEDYLEAILLLKKEKGNVRSIDIAEKLEFTKASVSIAMKSLREKGFISVGENGSIALTDKGLERAEMVLERHTIIAECLISLGVNSDVAHEDACRIEHDISEETFNAIKKHVKK
ncbi:MAG: metal-dependent transcriptional regulator [Clostridia bacterium]|nr:metal-dependent transcriptional regulator [Clostridia bacterium]